MRWTRRTETGLYGSRTSRSATSPATRGSGPSGRSTAPRTGAASYIATESAHRLLLPYFQAAPGQRSVKTEAFSDYVFVSGDQQVVRRNFRTRYGNNAVGKLKSTSADTVGASTRVDDTYKQALLTRVNRMVFVWDSPGGGRIEFPTERIPDHTRYRPLSIEEPEANGIRTVRYHTVTGQQFVATINSNNGLTMEVTGFNLSFMAGRGVTEDSPSFTAGNGFDRSHIIANEFGGSGFAVGRNLVTASAHYNQQIMRAAERRIGNSISAVAHQSGRTETQVSFTMTVNLTFGALRDPAALAQAKALPDFPADRVGTNLDAEILQKIHAGTVHPDLMRIMGVVYTWTFTDPPAPGSSVAIGPDLWLLTYG